MNRILLKNPKNSFTKGKIWTKTMAMLLLLMIFCFNKVNAQIAITVTGNTNTTPNLAASYPSLGAALTALNSITGMTGPITFQALSAGSETAPNKGFTIGSATLNPLLSATNTISILGAGQSIIAGIGSVTPISTFPDGMIKIVGADHVILSNFILNDNNTTNPATMEYGIGLFKLNNNDGCKNNIVRDMTINMKRINAVAGTAPMPNGATGIIMVNSTPTTAVIPLIPTAVSGSNSDNQFIANIIIGGINGFSLNGFLDVTPYTLADYNNYIGTSVIENFGTDVAPAIPAIGIATTNQFNINIEYNTINNNSGSGVNHVGNLYGMLIAGSTAAVTPSITNNFIELRNGSTNFQCQGIINACGTGSTVNINNNTVRFGYPNGVNPTAVAIRGINNASVPTTLNINNNTIEGIGGSLIAGTGETNFIINNTITITPNVNTNNNIIRNFERTGSAGDMYGIRIFATNWTANANTINNLKFSSVGSTGNIYGLTAVANTVNSSLTNNIISNLSIPFSGSINGIYDLGAAGTKIINSNQIYNFATSTGGSGGSIFRGIYCASGTTTISSNSIYSLNISGNDATTASSIVNGVRLLSTTNTLANNKIYDLSANSVFGNVYGIYNATVPATLYNNVISDLRAPNTSSTNGVNGILTSGSLNLYYNTILLNETVKNGANVGSNAVFFNSTGSLISRNNIFINKSVANGIGQATALFCSSFATTYDPSSNNNLLYGTTIFTDGTNSDTTLAAFKTRMATRDQASVTETTTPFISTLGSDAGFLRLPTNAVSVANNNAVPISSPPITTDYFGIVRSTTTPDIGASEFNGLVCTIPTVYAVSGGGNGCGTTGVPVGLVNSQTGVNYQLKLNGTATGGLVAGTGAALAFGSITVAGTYTVDATSNVVGCNTAVPMSANAIVTTSPGVTVMTYSQTNVSCFGGSNGTATVVAGIGTPPYTYSWFPTGGTSATTTGRAAGSYSCTITDAVGCTTFRGFTITQPPALSTVTSFQTNIACNGASTGAAGVNPSGGTSPYTYSWTNGATTNAISGLIAGTYTVTVTDANSCTSNRSFTITQPSALTTTGSQINLACFGGANGSASVSASGGTSPYTFLWSTGSTSNNIFGLNANTYSVTVTDANSCTATRSFTLTQPTSYPAGATVVTNVSCFGGSNGAINLTPSGGTAPHTFNWGGGIATEDRTGLAAGVYSVTITDANGCVRTVNNIFITQPALAVSGSTSQTNVACFGGSTGAINLTPAGGTAPYTFNWGGGITTEDRTGLAAGVYSVTITDANGCTAPYTYIISQFSAITATTSQTNVSCRTGSNGTATIVASGGAGSYTYSWSPSGGTGATATGLAAGTYTCTVTDANACSIFRVYTISQPSAIAATITQTNVSCNSGTNGAASIAVSGGTSGYTYNWTPGNPSGNGTSSVTGLTAGNYTCTVTDANGCAATRFFNITQPTTALNGTTVVTNVSCFGGSTGAINLTPTGGTAPYTFNWGGGITTKDRTGLAAGTYSVTITDANGCTKTESFTIAEPNALPDNVSTISACDSFTWNGTIYNQTGIYTGPTANCVTEKLNLTINSSTTTSSTATACDSYTWFGTTYTASGTYTNTTTNASGCANVETLTLTINTTPVISGNATQNFNVTDTLSNIIVSPISVIWYANLADANAGTSPLLATQVLTNNTTYYAVTTGNCPSVPFAVLVGTTLSNNYFNNQLNIKLYPNPSTGIFHLKLPQDLQIEIYNNLGQLLSSDKMLSGSNVINIADKPIGVYFLKATDGNNVSTFKIIKN